MDKNMEKDPIITRMATYISENGLRTKKMETEFSNILQALSTMDNGSMTRLVIKGK